MAAQTKSSAQRSEHELRRCSPDRDCPGLEAWDTVAARQSRRRQHYAVGHNSTYPLPPVHTRTRNSQLTASVELNSSPHPPHDSAIYNLDSIQRLSLSTHLALGALFIFRETQKGVKQNVFYVLFL